MAGCDRLTIVSAKHEAVFCNLEEGRRVPIAAMVYVLGRFSDTLTLLFALTLVFWVGAWDTL
jgi:hypothetical protein